MPNFNELKLNTTLPSELDTRSRLAGMRPHELEIVIEEDHNTLLYADSSTDYDISESYFSPAFSNNSNRGVFEPYEPMDQQVHLNQ